MHSKLKLTTIDIYTKTQLTHKKLLLISHIEKKLWNELKLPQLQRFTVV